MKTIFSVTGLSAILATPALAHPEPGSAAHRTVIHFLSEPDHILIIAGGIMLALLLARRVVRAGRTSSIRRHTAPGRSRHSSA